MDITSKRPKPFETQVPFIADSILNIENSVVNHFQGLFLNKVNKKNELFNPGILFFLLLFRNVPAMPQCFLLTLALTWSFIGTS